MIEVVAELASTSSELVRRITSGEPVQQGDWLIADRQTAGRGRHGRVWSDGEGNFMGSTFIAVVPGDPPAGTLALAIGLALHAAIGAYLPPTQNPLLKWPNDLLIDGAKLSGILLEGVPGGVVAGIGVNLVHAPAVPDRRTTCLAALGATPSRDAFAADLALAVTLEIERWRTYGLDPLIRRWMAAAHPLGTPLVLRDERDGVIDGTFAGLAADGALQLRLADGTMRVIHAGEINLANGS